MKNENVKCLNALMKNAKCKMKKKAGAITDKLFIPVNLSTDQLVNFSCTDTQYLNT